ncbi:MAG TPA: hypothetical protein VGI22_21590 [Xanthobacteraceae bacterium]|jgi:hypothetical protein
MLERSLLGAVALAALCLTTAPTRAWDDAKYPDLKGQWRPIGGPGRFDISKPAGRGQQAPLVPEYQAVFEANVLDQAAGGQGTTPTYKCLSPGMPRVTNGYGEMEFVVTPDTTYILVDHILDDRRIFTDGRDWPAELEPTLLGYSIGKWIDSGGSGHYDVLEVETRGFRGPRAFDASGIPLHQDGQTIVKERFYIDQADPNIAHDQVTVIDHALTRPWTVTKNYRRSPQPQPYWTEEYCESNNHVSIGKDDYMLSADGLLMPARKDQAPPDLRYFKTAK